MSSNASTVKWRVDMLLIEDAPSPIGVLDVMSEVDVKFIDVIIINPARFACNWIVNFGVLDVAAILDLSALPAKIV